MPGLDDQDQSEVFDEDKADASETGGVTGEYRTFEEQPEVLDLTTAEGDADDVAPDDGEPQAETPAVFDGDGSGPGTDPGVSDDRAGDAGSASEVELVYSGLLEDVRGAQASAAHWEARRLDDEDIEDLGYGPEGDGK